jgi:hypothetical protein
MNGPMAEAICRRERARGGQPAEVMEALGYLHELVVNAKSLLLRYAETDAALVGDDAYIERWIEAARGIE